LGNVIKDAASSLGLSKRNEVVGRTRRIASTTTPHFLLPSGKKTTRGVQGERAGLNFIPLPDPELKSGG